MSLTFFWPTRDLSTSSSNFPRLITSSLSINLIALTSYYTCQSRYHTHGILSPNHLKTRVAMIPVDQTNKACRSNAVRDLGGVQSISMITTQPKLIANGRAVKVSEDTRVCLTYLVFCNRASHKSVKGWKSVWSVW